MLFYITKVVVSAFLVVLVTELVKRTQFWGPLIASLPFLSILTIFWIYWETQDVPRIKQFSYSVFWLVLPSLVFFIVLPLCLEKLGFILSMFFACASALVSFALLLWVLSKFGMRIL
ncbi:MAG: DUF3147 family protein [Verrucomicrobiota bacterium]